MADQLTRLGDLIKSKEMKREDVVAAILALISSRRRTTTVEHKGERCPEPIREHMQRRLDARPAHLSSRLPLPAELALA